MYFSAAPSSENDHGMNLASKTAPVGSTMPSSVAAIHLMTGCCTRCWMSLIAFPVLRSYHCRLSASVAVPSCTIRLPDRSCGSISPRFSRHSRMSAGSSSPMMTRASEPPMKLRLFVESATLMLACVIVHPVLDRLRFNVWRRGISTENVDRPILPIGQQQMLIS
jgi:hypothetical protein